MTYVNTRQRAAELGLAHRPLTPDEWKQVCPDEYGSQVSSPHPAPSEETTAAAAEVEAAQAAFDHAHAVVCKIAIEREAEGRRRALKAGHALVMQIVQLPKFGNADPHSEDPLIAACAVRDEASKRLSTARGRWGILAHRDELVALGLVREA